jgi:hypothetical protein
MTLDRFCDLLEDRVKRKIVSLLLVATHSFYIGCYSTEVVSREELKTRVDQVDIGIFTRDSLKYEFAKGNYRVQGDTVSGYGIQWSNMSAAVVSNASLPFAVIDSVETRELNLARTIALCGGIGLGVVLIISLLSGLGPTSAIVVPAQE